MLAIFIFVASTAGMIFWPYDLSENAGLVLLGTIAIASLIWSSVSWSKWRSEKEK